MSGIVSILDKVFLYETKRRNLKQKFVFSIFDPIWRRFAEMIFFNRIFFVSYRNKNVSEETR